MSDEGPSERETWGVEFVTDDAEPRRVLLETQEDALALIRSRSIFGCSDHGCAVRLRALADGHLEVVGFLN